MSARRNRVALQRVRMKHSKRKAQAEKAKEEEVAAAAAASAAEAEAAALATNNDAVPPKLQPTDSIDDTELYFIEAQRSLQNLASRPLFDSSGNPVDIAVLETLIGYVLQIFEAERTGQRSQLDNAMKALVDVGEGSGWEMQKFQDVLRVLNSGKEQEFLDRFKAGSICPSCDNKLPSTLEKKCISGPLLDPSVSKESPPPIDAGSKTLQSESDAASIPAKSKGKQTSKTTQTAKEPDLRDDIILDLQNQLSELKDKLVRMTNSSSAEISELRENFRKANGSALELEEQLRKSNVGKKELQRLRSGMGEAESRAEQAQRTVARLEKENASLSCKLEVEQQWSRKMQDNARRKVLDAQMASLRTICEMELRSSELYIAGLQHLSRNIRVPSKTGQFMTRHVALCKEFKSGLEGFLRRCEDRCAEALEGAHPSENYVDLSSICEPFDAVRPAMPVAVLEVLMPALSSFVGDALREGRDIDMRQTLRNPRGSNSPAKQSQQDCQAISQHSSHHYTELVRQICRALPQLSQEECYNCLSWLKQSNDGRLSGLPVPYIIRQIARRQSAAAEGSYLAWTDGGRRGAAASSSDDGDVGICAPEECCICLGPLVEGKTIELPKCGHIFHTECIRGWLKEKRDCPFCRKFTILHDEYPDLH